VILFARQPFAAADSVPEEQLADEVQVANQILADIPAKEFAKLGVFLGDFFY
jgi:hypothetical protein